MGIHFATVRTPSRVGPARRSRRGRLRLHRGAEPRGTASCSTCSSTRPAPTSKPPARLRGGRETFVTMKLPQSITLAGTNGSDDVELYLAAMSSHDGTAAWRVIVTPVRIVCANTQHMALRRASPATRSGTPAPPRAGSLRPARRWGSCERCCEVFETAAQALINQPLDGGRVASRSSSDVWRRSQNDNSNDVLAPASRRHPGPAQHHPAAACSPTPTPSSRSVARAGPGCRPSPSTSTTSPRPRRHRPRRAGAHLPRARRAQAAHLRPAHRLVTGLYR